MNAVILAGGFGSRLMPITDKIVKPMVTLSGKPVIDYTISHLISEGISDCVFTLAHYPEQIIDYVTGFRGLKCSFSVENEPKGTLGGVKAAERFLDDTFLVMSGDALEDINLRAMYNKHKRSGALVTMAVKPELNTHLYGVVVLDAWGTVVGFQEKPQRGEEKSRLINCGVYIVDKKALQYVPDGVKFDFAKDLFPMLTDSGLISAYIHDGYWRDIGDIKSYYAANFDVLEGGFFPSQYNSETLKYSSYKIGGERKSVVAVTSRILGRINNSIVGQNSIISSGASIEECIVLDNTTVKGRHFGEIIGSDFTLNVTEMPFMMQDNLKNYRLNNFS